MNAASRNMGLIMLIASAALGIAPAFGADVLAHAAKLELEGKFKEAGTELRAELESKSLPAAERNQLEFELDRLDRIRKDFPFEQDALLAELKKSVKDLTSAEFDRWVADGWFDTRVIDGQRKFMISSVSNLFFRHPELDSRRVPPKDTGPTDRARMATIRAIKEAARLEKKPYVLPRQFHVTMTVTAHSNVVASGETIRAWLPIPRDCPFQNGFELVQSSSPVRHLDPAESRIRSLFLEQAARTNEPTEFTIEYNYTINGVFFDVDPSRVQPAPADASLTEFTKQAPHIVFTPEIKALSARIAGGETNAAVKAKKFFDWIADNIQYSYAIEYSTIRNISDYCRSRGYGDCGQEALLFMTLCRLNGIPARWQSGWNLFPGGKTIHDWCEIYLAPYGWMPVDPYEGIYAMRYAKTLTPEQKRELRDFYFGGLDYYRLAANSDHSQELSPPKRTMRSDDVDFQRGELEAGDRNLYFDQFSYDLKYTERGDKVP